MAVVADQMAFPMHAVAAGAVLLPFMREMRIELRIQFLSALGEIVIGTMARQALVHGWLFRRIAAFMAGSARQILVASLRKRRGVSRSGREHEARDHREKQSCFRHTFLLWLAAVFIDLTTHS